MTIAAGFRFADGIVLCSDSEETTGQSVKVQVPKIEVIDKRHSMLVLTGAGDADMLNRAFEQIEAEVGARYTHDAIRRTIEQIVRSLNETYVYPIPGEDKPFFELIVAYHTVKGSDFIKISRNATVRPKTYQVIGYGALHGIQLMDRLYRSDFSDAEAILLATYLLQQTIRYVPYCGGESRIMILRPNGRVERVPSWRVRMDEDYAESFDSTLRSSFFACIDRRISADKFRKQLAEVVNRLHELRGRRKKRPGVLWEVAPPCLDSHQKSRKVKTIPEDAAKKLASSLSQAATPEAPEGQSTPQRSKRGRSVRFPSRA